MAKAPLLGIERHIVEIQPLWGLLSFQELQPMETLTSHKADLPASENVDPRDASHRTLELRRPLDL